jgi:DNA replicative helicase MCM subunit Mcm2 (Cdc46/Mcm family)
MDKVGKLVAIKGTVTRTSEVRPELLFGTFRCSDCTSIIKDVEQEFKYTEVTNFPLLLDSIYIKFNFSSYCSLRHVQILYV